MIISLSSLIVVILAGAAGAFVTSAVCWMLLPHHRSDYASLGNEDATLEVLKSQNLKPGFYNFPHCKTWDDMKNEDILRKFNEGPVGFLTIVSPGMPPMGRNMIQQFSYFVITGVVIAYVVGMSNAAGADYMSVFRTTAVVSWLAYGFGSIPDSIWYGRPWTNQAKIVFDALLYSLVTAGIYGWLWPASV